MSEGPPTGAARARAAHESRSRRQFVFAVVLATIGFFVLVVFGVGGLLVGAAGVMTFAIVIGGAFLATAWSLYRKARPTEVPARVRVEPADGVRGGRVEVIVEPTAAAGLGTIEIELICIERYAVRERHDGDWVRRTREARELEVRQVMEGGGGVAAFDIPATAPYSHQGDVLSYEWRVEVTQPRRRRLDARQVVPLWVRP